MASVVIGIGARRAEDFGALGAEAGEAARDADVLVAVREGEAIDLRSGDPVPLYLLDDVDPVLLECCERIKVAWEAKHLENAHLGHAAAGFWLFYWVAPDARSISRLARIGDAAGLRRAASDYIDSGFAADRGPALEVA